MRLSQWGVVQAWLSMGPSRAIALEVLGGELLVIARDGVHTESVKVGPNEDPSRAALRATTELGKRFG